MRRSYDTCLKHISGMSEATVSSFRSAHRSFAGIEGLIEAKPAEEGVYDALQARMGGADLHPATVQSYFSRIRQYLHYRGIKLDDAGVRQNLVFPVVPEDEKHPLGLEEFGLILERCDHRRRILYLAQSSSGMRIGEIVRLRRKHRDATAGRVTVRIPAAFTKTRRGRTTFLSSETSELLRPRLEGMSDSDLIFGVSEDPVRATLTEQVYLSRLVDRLGLGGRRGSSRNRKITTHSFRAYFITRASRHDPNLAMMLAGQAGYLLRYDRPTEKEKLRAYLKIKPDLLVTEQARRWRDLLEAGLLREREILELEGRHAGEIRQLMARHAGEIDRLRRDLEIRAQTESVYKAIIDTMQRRLDEAKGRAGKSASLKRRRRQGVGDSTG